MGHGTSSGRNAAGGANRPDSLENFRSREVERLLGRGIDQQTANDIANANTMGEALKRLDRIFDETRDQGPEATVDRLVSEIGEEAAARTVATLVNRAGDDGRIDNRNREWAGSVQGAVSRDEGLRRGIGSDRIHRAHVDQIASAMRRRQEARQVGNNNFGSQVLRRNNRAR